MLLSLGRQGLGSDATDTGGAKATGPIEYDDEYTILLGQVSIGRDTKEH